ncbi:hypothetical protein [Caballeronia sp. LZ032]|uniref:hypothetical protein n=1 Tax=Caballeronia sp. LZ032 TaxID=3038565 RepID=UPI00285F4DF2|nr:hypothetical protein [Caballeronia sp. LZ032]MDR5880505.1 hypothetical protein [Caballeronia sp. LZ032]
MQLVRQMRSESADFIGASSGWGCKKAAYKAATYPVESEHKKTWRIGGVHINQVENVAAEWMMPMLIDAGKRLLIDARR